MPSAINTTRAARINLRITSQAEMLSQPEGWIWPLGHSAPRLSTEFLGSEPKFAEPSARPGGAAQRAAAKLVSDPNNSSAEYPSGQIVHANLVCEQRVHQRSLPRAMQWVA